MIVNFESYVELMKSVKYDLLEAPEESFLLGLELATLNKSHHWLNIYDYYSFNQWCVLFRIANFRSQAVQGKKGDN